MELLDDLESQIKTMAIEPQKQSELAKSTCCACIYTVPNLIRTNGRDAYCPQVVSIGPKHISRTVVDVMKKHKVEFLFDLLMRKKNNLDFNDLMASIHPLATKARACYSNGMIDSNFFPDEDDFRFLKMMVLDGCFLIELFLKAADKKSKDPLALIPPQAVPYVYGDLLLLENQIPFFVLEELFTTIIYRHDAPETSMPEDSYTSLSFLALRFFNKVMRWPDGVIEKFRKGPKDQTPLHLLDLVRSTCIPTHDTPKNNEAYRGRIIRSISKLSSAGIKLKLNKQADSFLDVKFSNGAIQVPNIIINHTMKTFLLNCVAFERLHNSLSKHFTVYASFLDCLVDSIWDVEQLCESNIVDSYFGKYDDVVEFINNMGKDLVFDDNQFYLSHVFKDVNDRYQSKWFRYFNSTWTFISSLAAFVLLVLTLLQTFYTISAYYVK